MLLKPRVMDPRAKDDISEALAYDEYQKDENGEKVGESYRVVPSYAFHWYPNNMRAEGAPTLKDRTWGPHSKELVGFTRYYPTTVPKVVVDFEPAPPEPFWEEQKRQFCIELRIAYIPIYLGDRLTDAEFRERADAAKQVAIAGHYVLRQDAALKAGTELSKVLPPTLYAHGVDGVLPQTAEEWMQDAELLRHLDRRALERVDSDEVKNGRKYRGFARTAMLRRYKRELMDEVRGGIKNGRIVDPRRLYCEPAAAAE